MEKISRNDLCPCGSGKKFKKCCENQKKTRTFHLLSSEQRVQEICSLLFKKTEISAGENEKSEKK